MESGRRFTAVSLVAAIAVAQSILLMSIPAALAAAPPTSQTNSVEVPKQILRTGINLEAKTVSPNTLQLAQNLNLLPILSRLQELRARVAQHSGGNTLESLSDRQELLELTQKAQSILIRTSLEIDFVLAEIDAEQNLYSEVLSSLQGSRDKLVARINAGSFILNGALWTVCEALAIVSPLHPNYAIQSGIVGIAAGIVPSIASGYALKAYSGKRLKSECEPNMLAKIFDRPINQDIDYPKSVWSFLNTVPASDGNSAGQTRKEQLIARWISDKNIPSFTDKASSKEIDVITATSPQKKGLSIDNLNVRMVMLEQLQGELAKMKRLLMEIAMVITEEKEV
ncbi:MAG: hypothetical protein C0508_17065 [Cyanobacteria bacterium PR.023]|nr:hypothetical protein [Cyanobacteria bacterium PR.023]